MDSWEYRIKFFIASFFLLAIVIFLAYLKSMSYKTVNSHKKAASFFIQIYIFDCDYSNIASTWFFP